MKTIPSSYDIERSIERIDDILDTDISSFKSIKSIPQADRLEYTKSYCCNVGVIFIEVRQTWDMRDEFKRFNIGRMYRTYISEITALLNSFEDCKEIKVFGNQIMGIFESQYKKQLENMFKAGAKLNALVEILNYKFKMKDISPIQVGIGLDYGRAILVRSGFDGGRLLDSAWIGDVINSAMNLGYNSNRDNSRNILVGVKLAKNLGEKEQRLLSPNKVLNCYEGNIANGHMTKWFRENCR